MSTDLRHRYGVAVEHRLEPGERILALSEAKRPHGLTPDPPPRPAPTPDPRAKPKVAAMSVVNVALSGLEFLDNLGGGGPSDWLIRLFFGRAASRRHDSIAGGFPGAVATDQKLLVVATDRRLMVFRVGHDNEIRPFGTPPEPLAPAKLKSLWSVPRAEVTGARRRWHRLHGGRLRVIFRDGSWWELTGPICLGRRRAAELAAALRT